HRMTRPWCLPPVLARRALVAAVGSLLLPRPLRAEEVPVPLDLQAELLDKVAGYDRNFAARAAGEARVLLVTRNGDPDSARAASHLTSTLGRLGQLGGVRASVSAAALSSPAALRSLVTEQRLAVVYLMPGLAEAAEPIAAALVGADILTVAVEPRLVARGTVLGFDLVSGKPKLLCHLGQARRQNVLFKAEILKLMKVYE
ncbi:MAG: DUF4154 domain-containing protein, partial [Myxococcales bacterium]